jgi:hypothetical protein
MTNLNRLKRNKYILSVLAFSIASVVASFTNGGNDPIASNSKIVHGKTGDAVTKKDFNSGEEIYLYIPLKENVPDKNFIRLEADGESILAKDLLTYESERKLNYYAFSLAINPSNHYAEQYFYKEGQYSRTLEALSKLSVGKHKITFGLSTSLTSAYTNKISITINVTEEGAKKWAEWSAALISMDEEYRKKLGY